MRFTNSSRGRAVIIFFVTCNKNNDNNNNELIIWYVVIHYKFNKQFYNIYIYIYIYTYYIAYMCFSADCRSRRNDWLDVRVSNSTARGLILDTLYDNMTLRQLRGGPGGMPRRHQTCYFRKHATSAPEEFGGEIHNGSRNRAHTQVLPQAQEFHVYGSGTFGAFGNAVRAVVAVSVLVRLQHRVV